MIKSMTFKLDPELVKNAKRSIQAENNTEAIRMCLEIVTENMKLHQFMKKNFVGKGKGFKVDGE